MKPDKTLLTKKSLTLILALSLMTGILSACSFTAGKEKPTHEAGEPTVEFKPEYGLAVETTGYGGPGIETTAWDDSDYVFNKDDWYVREYEDKGIKYTQIQNSGWHGRQAEIDNILFKVYEDEADAQKAFGQYYDKSKSYDKGHWEEGDNWFISDEWGVMDASIVWMVYREGNVLIIADLAMNGHWIVYGDDGSSSGAEPTESSYKAYVLNNVTEIIRFVKENFPEAF